MSTDGPHRLRDILDALGGRLGLGPAVETGLLWRRWPEIAGPAVAAHAEPTSLRGGVLRVRTDAPAWATELSYLSAQIKNRANELTGREVVTEVRVWTAPGPVSRALSPSGTAPGKSVGPELQGDPMEALGRAHAAWARRRRRGVI